MHNRNKHVVSIILETMTYIRLFSREYSVQYADACMRMAGPENKSHTPLVIRTCLYFPEKGNETFCMKTTEWQTFRQKILEKFDSKQSLKKLAAEFHRFGKKYVAAAQTLGSRLVCNGSTKTKIKFYREYFSVYSTYTLYLWYGLLIADHFSEKGQKLLVQKNISDSAVIDSLFSPAKKSGILLLQEKLSELKKQGITQLSPETKKRLAKEYAWMPCLDVQNNPWNEKDIDNFFATLIPVLRPALSVRTAVKKAKLSKSEQKLFENIREQAFIRDQRDVYRRKGVFNALAFYDSAAKKIGLTRKDLAYLTKDEIIAALQTGKVPSQNEIRLRQKGFLCRLEKNAVCITTNPGKIREIASQIQEEKQTAVELSGFCASKGTVQGKVKVVRGVADLFKVKKGDVLVAITTHPDFVPAMHRAAAFVTDEGGLISHAAIVAREMRKPCIVGTKNATAVLKDNDLVKVNADNGTVSLIKTPVKKGKS